MNKMSEIEESVRTIVLAILVLLFMSCGSKPNTSSAHRGVYHWKTTYNPSDWEKKWMKDHKIDRLYVRLFDVEAGIKANEPDWKMVPIATTKFVQQLPKDIEVVPVVYITVDAIRAIGDQYWSRDNERRYAKLILKRIDDMMADQYEGNIKEIQLDCDWTESTEFTFFCLALEMKKMLHERGMTLSGTLRLHQLREVEMPIKKESYYRDADSIPFDRSLLMVYNTGNLHDRNTRNSILDISDVMPYLRTYHADSLPRTDVAYPVYGWGVEYDKDGSFKKLINSNDMPAQSNDSVRIEWGEPDEIRQVQNSLPVLDKQRTTILYHLDSLNLSRYSYEDIEAFYSR